MYSLKATCLQHLNQLKLVGFNVRCFVFEVASFQTGSCCVTVRVYKYKVSSNIPKGLLCSIKDPTPFFTWNMCAISPSINCLVFPTSTGRTDHSITKLTLCSEEISLRVFFKRLCINHQNLSTKIKIPSQCDRMPYIIQWRYKDFRSWLLKTVFAASKTWTVLIYHAHFLLAPKNRLIHLSSGWSQRHFWLAVMRHISQLGWGNVPIKVYVSI